MRIIIIFLLAAFTVSGCSGGASTSLPDRLPPSTLADTAPTALPEDYRLGPLDAISIQVFNEPQLSFDSLPVSLSGKISYPLLGEIKVAGLTTEEVSAKLTSLLNSRYLRNASVAVSLEKSSNFVVTIDGQVERPGVYQIPTPHLSLQQAIALGEGVTDVAKLNEVLVIRTIKGQRYVARFDLAQIRYGEAPDPEIRQSDIVVVGFSQSSQLLKTAIAALPGVAGLFVAITR